MAGRQDTFAAEQVQARARWWTGLMATLGGSSPLPSSTMDLSLLLQSLDAAASGDLATAAVLSQQATTSIPPAAPHPRHRAWALRCRGVITTLQGNQRYGTSPFVDVAAIWERAIQLHQEALTLAQQHHLIDEQGCNLLSLADLAQDRATQRAYLDQTLTLAVQHQLPHIHLAALLARAGLAHECGNLARAAAMTLQASHIAEQLGNQRAMHRAIWRLGLLDRDRGDDDRAAARFQQARAIAQQDDLPMVAAYDDQLAWQTTMAWRREQLTAPPPPTPVTDTPDDDLAILQYSRDARDRSVWDQFWQEHVRQQQGWLRAEFGDQSGTLIAALHARGCQTVLCAANGLSLEPRVLALAGFRVTAMDLSPTATRIAETATLDRPVVQTALATYQYIQAHPELAVPEQSAAPVTFLTGSLFDAACCPGPVDAIIIRKTLQYFRGPKLMAALTALINRLSPRGVVIVEAKNNYPSLDIAKIGLRWQGIVAVNRAGLADALTENPDERVVWLAGRSGL